MTIWKYPIPTRGTFALRMPQGAKILSLQVQNGIPCLWAMVDESARVKQRVFRTRGTGFPCDDLMELPFVGTYQQDSLVWHVFDSGDSI